MYKEYLELYNTYSARFGPKTAIFLMVGSFYELYDIQNQETGETQCNVREIVDILGIQLSTKKGDFSENCDGLFAGFPDYVMHKWAGRLTSIGWTVVIVNQVKDHRGKVKERKVERILSPSTHIENTTSTDTPYVATLYFDQSSASFPPTFGAALLDLTTGSTHTYSGKATGRPDIWTADDLVQLLSVFQPKELLVYWRGSTAVPTDALLRRMFGIAAHIAIHRYPVETLGAFAIEQSNADYLRKIYTIKSLLPPRTYLGLQSDQEELALLFLLQFVEEHYPSMVKSFHRNEHWNPQARLVCGNHALTQLQMTGPQLHETVIGLFDKCITVMGKRAIKERLLRPYSQPTDIRARLQEVNEYLHWSEDKRKLLERQLRFMADLPRLHRKTLCGLVTSEEIVGLFQTYHAMNTIMSHVTRGTCLKEPFTSQQWDEYRAVFGTHFSEEKALQANKDSTPFSEITYPDIGTKEQEIQHTLQGFYALRKEIANIGGIQEDAIRMEEKEKEPFGFKASTITLQHLKRKLEELPKGTKLSELKSGGWIDCAPLQQLNTKLTKLREELQHLVNIHLAEACHAISEAGQMLWSTMEEWICLVDATQCIGSVSREKGYTCPDIQDLEDKEGSALEIQNLRHPLVEASATRTHYVKHNVELGYSQTKGWLVYGMNASGKSTLMKATGLCVLLAQAGCFVPAKSMRLKPFQAIYTRILNQDNLFAGLSSFAVEMSELRDILRHANQYTMVLGDELCSGTESISAQALVASGIQWLSAKKAKFMFATHLHDLPNYVDTQSLGVDVWHLHVDYDPSTKKLVYDRSLRPGSGSTLYGLEVARAMDLPFEFIEQALANRHKMMGTTTQQDATTSAWNRNIIRKECEVCQTPVVRNLEVHHVQERATATNGILEDGTVMNNKENLMVLCEKCHDKVHAGTLVVGNTTMTSDGPVREIQIRPPSPVKEEKPHKKGKWSEEEMGWITEALKQYSALSLKSIRALLSSKYGVEISEGVLGKMRREF
jgi:DNA mismatch repair protein MutS